MTKAVSNENLALFKQKCDETYLLQKDKITVVANPTTAGTEELTSLQVGGIVYNIPQGGAVEYATDEEIDALFEAAEPQDELIGTWVFNDTLSITDNNLATFSIGFSSAGETFNEIVLGKNKANFQMQYLPIGSTPLAWSDDYINNGWWNVSYKTIQITDISALTNREEFETWLKANATKQ